MKPRNNPPIGRKAVQRIEFIREFCRGKRVLHLGCTNWPYTQESIKNGMLLHSDLAEVSREVHGFDVDPKGIAELTRLGYRNLYEVDLERLDGVEIDEQFDVVVAGEMIEHLNNPGLFLDGIKKFIHPETRLLLTTINAYCGMRFFIYGLRGKKGVNEPVHPDHVAYYSYSTLNLLLDRHGFDVDEFHFYDIGREHRPFNPKIYNLVNDLFVLLSPQLSDGIIAVCRRSDAADMDNSAFVQDTDS